MKHIGLREAPEKYTQIKQKPIFSWQTNNMEADCNSIVKSKMILETKAFEIISEQ